MPELAPVKLKPQYEAFINELFNNNFKIGEAAIVAGFTSATGSNVLRRPEVEAEIRRRRGVNVENTEIDAQFLITHLSRIIKADIGEITDENGDYLPLHTWPLIWRQMVSSYETRQTKAGTVVKVRFIEKLDAIEKIGKHVDVQAWNEKKSLSLDGIGSELAAALLRVDNALSVKTIEGETVQEVIEHG
jgi:terminase small subunit-like protein